MSAPIDDPGRQPGRPRSPQSHQAILDATVELLAEAGLQGTTIEAIAARAGVGKATIYRRWRTKEEVVADALAQLRPRCEMPDTCDLWRDFHTFLKRAVAAYETVAPQILALIISAADRNPEFLDIYWSNWEAPRRAAIAERLERAKAAGQIRADLDADLVMDLICGAVLYRLLLKPPPEPFGSYIRRAFGTLWHGMKGCP